MNEEEFNRLNAYYRRRLNLVAFIGFTAVVCIIAASLIHRVKNEPIEMIEIETSEIPYDPFYGQEYGYSDVEELDYYHDLAELEERTMAMLMELREPTQEWYDTYQEINKVFEDVGQPDELTETYPSVDLRDMYWVVENEARGAGFEAKTHVANVILNRVSHERFPNDIASVCEQPNQFSCWVTHVSEETKAACAYAFEFPDNTNGALFFQRSSKPPHGLAWIMSDDAGHNFFGYAHEVNAIKEEPEVAEPTPEEVSAPTGTPLITEDNTENYEQLLEESVG